MKTVHLLELSENIPNFIYSFDNLFILDYLQLTVIKDFHNGILTSNLKEKKTIMFIAQNLYKSRFKKCFDIVCKTIKLPNVQKLWEKKIIPC